MKHNLRWLILLGISLLTASVIVYYIHYLIFDDPHHIFIYMVGDVAFVFIEVLLVTLIIHRVLSVREKRQRMEKLNMVIGTFFSEVGTKLLTYFSDFDPKLENIRGDLIVNDDWTDEEFARVSEKLSRYDYQVEAESIELNQLGSFLVGKRGFLLTLMENPNLLEHESFTSLLQAVFHLTEELAARGDVTHVPESDREHLINDVKRVYSQLVIQWLDYMKHLKANYPFFFNYALRTNPFDQTASPFVK
ncbi:MAG: hypothetical protein R6U37_00840 [Dehalococcoidia bacterium]